MRKLLALSLLVLAGCDSQPEDDLDLGDFRGFDASVQADVGGPAFHGLARAEAGGPAAVPVRFHLGSGEHGSRTVELALPFSGVLAPGVYALDAGASATVWAQDHSAASGARESSMGGTVTVQEVRRTGDYADVLGSVEVEFPSGTVTGTFRAVDQDAPIPQSRCDTRGCVDY